MSKNKIDLIIEYCAFCEREVSIPSNKKSHCPCCKNVILPCSMCNLDELNCNTDCPYSSNKELEHDKNSTK